MKLLHLKVHMRGKAILANGTHYKVDSKGVIVVEDADDAKRLLASPDCVPYKKPQKAPDASKSPSKPVPPKEPVEAPETAPEAVEAGSETAEPEETAGEPEEAPEEAPEAPEESPEDAGEDWPDPDVSMKKAYLQDMAEAYQVEYTDKTTKAQLVELIHAKMYE